MKPLHFDVRFVPVGTGMSVLDTPHALQMIERFMPRGRNHGPMIGILHFADAHPTANVLSNVVTIGQDVQAGRYGNFSFVVSAQDQDTRELISYIASARSVPMFVTSSATDLNNAEPVGDLTPKDRETLDLVLTAGGTVTAGQLADRCGIEQTTAGNRLIALHKKGYLQRVVRPHPIGDEFLDPRSVRFDQGE